MHGMGLFRMGQGMGRFGDEAFGNGLESSVFASKF